MLTTEEPGGTDLGRQFWAFLQERARAAAAPLEPLAELLLFEAARAQHVAEVIRPALAAGRVVLCDRFADSSIAYQGYGRGLDLALVEEANRIATGGLAPDLTLLLDVPVEAGLARAKAAEAHGGAKKAPDAIGQETLAFHERVREGFLEIARKEPGRVAVIDTTRPQEAVLEAAWEVVGERL